MSNENNVYSLITKNRHKIDISDTDKKITLTTSDGKQKIILDESGGTVFIEADKKILLKAQEIKIDGKLFVKSQTVSIESDSSLVQHCVDST